MSKVCEICSRGYNKANIRSHSKIATIKRQQTNLQSMVVDGEKVKACTRCIRTAAKS